MEIETVMSYIANSVNPDGVRAQEIIESLAAGHPGGARARAAVRRAHQGALRRRAGLDGLHAPSRPTSSRPTHQTDIVHVIKGVIEAETGAIEHYNLIIEETDGHRPGDQRHGHRDPARRGGPPPPVRGLPARVPGGGQGLRTRWPTGADGHMDRQPRSVRPSVGLRRRGRLRIGRRRVRVRNRRAGLRVAGGTGSRGGLGVRHDGGSGTTGVGTSTGCGTSMTAIRTSCARGRRPRRPSRRRAPARWRALPWPRPCAPPDGPRGAARRRRSGLRPPSWHGP